MRPTDGSAVQITKQKNGKYKVWYGTPQGNFRSVGKFDNRKEAESLKAEIIANIRKSYA